MNIILNEQQYIILLERSQQNPLAEHIRKTLRDVYEPLGNYGSIQDPDKNCQTNEGVINVYPVSKYVSGLVDDEWSVLNWFDTNSRVKKQIEEWYKDETKNNNPSDDELKSWITKNKIKLFNGEWTEKLVDLNKDTIDRGIKNETQAMDILKEKLGSNVQIRRFCSGSVQDTRMGQDLAVKIGDNEEFFVQVKPLKKVESKYDADGDTFFVVSSPSFDNKRYKPQNVDLFFFVNNENGEYVGFRNKPNKIYTQYAGLVRFYEPWELTNISFEQSKLYKPSSKKVSKVEDDIFKVGERRLQNLEFRRKQIEKLIDDELQKLKQTKTNNSEK
jgi:hypothetical protein